MTSLLRCDRVDVITPVTQIPLVQNLSLDIQAGEWWFVVGRSGAGKSTFLRLLNRLMDPTHGELFYQDRPYLSYTVCDLRTQIVLLPQAATLLGLTVAETLIYPLTLQGLSPQTCRDRLLAWLPILDIPEDWLERKEGQLSGGQKQRIALARALILQPRILVMDEATSALDLGRSHQVYQQLKHWGDSPLTVISVTHQLHLAKDFADWVLHLEKGQIRQIERGDRVNWDDLTEIMKGSGRSGEHWGEEDDREDDFTP